MLRFGFRRCAAANPRRANWQGVLGSSMSVALTLPGKGPSRPLSRFTGQPILSNIGLTGKRPINIMTEERPGLALSDVRSLDGVLPPLRRSSRRVFLHRHRLNWQTIAFKAR